MTENKIFAKKRNNSTTLRQPKKEYDSTTLGQREYMKSIKINLACFTYLSTPLRLYFDNIINFHMNMKIFMDGSASSFNITFREAYHRIHILWTPVIQIISIEINSLPLTILPYRKTSSSACCQSRCKNYTNCVELHSINQNNPSPKHMVDRTKWNIIMYNITLAVPPIMELLFFSL